MPFPIPLGLFQFDLIDHYAVLGVSVDADPKEIRERYLKIAHKLHPDTSRGLTPSEREIANQLLSKLVNPAYEHLSKDLSRNEFRLILGQIGKGIARDVSKMTISSEIAQKLSQSNANSETAYQKALKSIAIDQYTNLEAVYQKIAQLSELNMVYLSLTEGGSNQKTTKPIFTGANTKTATPATPPTPKAEPETPKESLQDAYIRRAKEALNNNNPAQAIRELRDVLQKEPENGVCHALLGLAYLRQNQASMARIHINRAWKADPKNPTVIECKKEIDKAINPNIEMQEVKPKKEEPAKDGGFWTLFGGKKK